MAETGGSFGLHVRFNFKFQLLGFATGSMQGARERKEGV